MSRKTRSELDAHAERLRKWRAENPEAAKAINDRAYKKHRAAILRNKRDYYQRVVKQKEKTPKGRDLDRLKKSKTRAIKAGCEATITHAEWPEIVRSHGGKCHYCQKRRRPLCQDHVLPIERGGGHTKSNVVPACVPCNSSKSLHYQRPPNLEDGYKGRPGRDKNFDKFKWK